MKKYIRCAYTPWMLGLLILLIGCASRPPTRFYVLSPASAPEGAQRPPETPCFSIGIGPVRIPEYLGRSGIVTNLSAHELMVGDFNKWAEPLEENLPRVLGENLSYLLCTKTVFILPASRGTLIDYQVRMEVIRMDGKLGDTAVLDVLWTIVARKEELLTKRSIYREKTGGEGYEEYVSAQSRNVASLSGEIAKAILARSK